MRAVLRRAHLRVAGSRFGRVCDVRVVARVTDTLYTMTVEDVLAMLDALAAAGVHAWLAGGWGVDALLGRQTRPHTDLDLMVDDAPATVAAATRALVAGRLRRVTERPASGPMPAHVLFADLTGRSVDLLAVASADDALAPVTGVLAGRPVPCLPASAQVRLHQGIPLSRAARADIAALMRAPAPGTGLPASPPSAARDRHG